MNSQSTWAIYIRVSTRHQAEDGFSLEDQREKLTAYADQRGWDYVVYEDPGISGETLDQRAGLVALLDAVDKGDIAGVLIVDESRLARDEFIAATIRHRLKKAGVKLASPGRGESDLSNPSDNFTANVLSAAHALEQDIRTSNMKSGLMRTVKAGFWPGGPPPFGYRLVDDPGGSKHKVLEVNTEEADILHRAGHLITTEGYTTYSVATRFNAEGIRTRKGRPWRHQNLSWQLRRPHLTGTWTYRQSGVSVPLRIPTIFTDDEWGRVQEAIKGRPRPQRHHRVYPLTGRERCHLRCSCGGNLSGKTDRTKNGMSWYLCSGNPQEFGIERCPHIPRSIRTEEIETAVLDALRPVFNVNYVVQLAQTLIAEPSDDSVETDLRALANHIDRLHQEKVTIARKLAQDGDLDFLRDAVADIDIEIEALQSQHRELGQRAQLRTQRASIEDQVRVIADQMKAKLDNLDEKEYAELVDTLQLDLVRVGSTEFVGSASIPVPVEGGEIWTEGPRHHGPRRR
jgi:site-specific DNA recombinase